MQEQNKTITDSFPEPDCKSQYQQQLQYADNQENGLRPATQSIKVFKHLAAVCWLNKLVQGSHQHYDENAGPEKK